MKIREVRELLKDYSVDQLKLIIGEMYKLIPKKVIEDKEIDELLKAPEKTIAAKKNKRQVVERPCFEEVKEKTELFIEYAQQQYYFAPNRIIPKKERPKWRFIAKQLYKDLLVLSHDPEHLLQVSELLEKLYCLICEACEVYLFNTDEPFRSVGVDQDEFYRQVVAVKKRACLSHSEDWISSSIRLIVDSGIDREMTYTCLMHVLLEFLGTASLKEQAIQRCDGLRNEKTGKTKNRYVSDKYAAERRNNNLVEMVFILHMALGEHDEAIGYFKSHYIDWNNEVRLYVLLRWLLKYQITELWVREYEVAVRQGIKPRNALVNAYKQIKETGTLPEYY